MCSYSACLRKPSPSQSLDWLATKAILRTNALDAYKEPPKSMSYLRRCYLAVEDLEILVLLPVIDSTAYALAGAALRDFVVPTLFSLPMQVRCGRYSYHSAGRYSMSPGLRSTRRGLLRWENRLRCLMASSGSQVAQGTVSSGMSGTMYRSPKAQASRVSYCCMSVKGHGRGHGHGHSPMSSMLSAHTLQPSVSSR